jgi:heme/copper-type cytochrome/quinol oxidase subunit 2
MPNPATKKAPDHPAAVAGISGSPRFAVGALVWGLILWSCFAYRRSRHGIEVPPQTRYNLPLELLYTAIPLIMVGVIFYFTAKDETSLLQINNTQYTSINVVGRQWSWTFNYNYDASLNDGGGAATSQDTAYDIGTPGQLPTLYLPEGEEVKFTLTSPDVIHSFWIPSFLFKLDVVPGRVNMFEVTPDRLGTFGGECAELCGVEWITSTDHKTIGYLYLITVVPVLLPRRRDGAGSPHPAQLFGLPGEHAARRNARAVQPAVHDARHDHAADVRDPAVRRLRQRDHAAADRRARTSRSRG